MEGYWDVINRVLFFHALWHYSLMSFAKYWLVLSCTITTYIPRAKPVNASEYWCKPAAANMLHLSRGCRPFLMKQCSSW